MQLSLLSLLVLAFNDTRRELFVLVLRGTEGEI